MAIGDIARKEMASYWQQQYLPKKKNILSTKYQQNTDPTYVIMVALQIH